MRKELLLLDLPHTDYCLIAASIDLSMKVDTVFHPPILVLLSPLLPVILSGQATTEQYVLEFLLSLVPVVLLCRFC